MADPPRKRRSRKVALFAVLALLALIAILINNWVVFVPNALARRAIADRRFDTAKWWLRISDWIDSKNPDTELILARLYRKTEDFDQSLGHVLRAAEFKGDKSRVAHERWLIDAQSGRTRSAMSELAEILANQQGEGPEICEAFVLGCIKSRTMMGTAYELCEVWLKDYPQDPQPHFVRAQLSAEHFDLGRAEQELRKSLTIDPHHSRASIALGNLLLDKQQPDEAIEHFRNAKTKKPDRAAALTGEAKCLRLLGNYDESRAVLNRLLEASPKSLELNIEIAKIDLDIGDHEASIKRLEPFVKEDEKNGDLNLAYATGLHAVGRTEEAKEYFERAARIKAQLSHARQLKEDALSNPDDSDLRLKIAQIQIECGNDQDGLTWLHSILDSSSDHRPALQMLAEYYETRPNPSRSEVENASRYRRLFEGQTIPAE